MSPNMVRRVTVAALGIPAALGIVYLGGWVLSALLALLAVAGAAEFYALANRGGVRPVALAGYVGALAIPLVAYATYAGGIDLGMRWIALGAALWLIVTTAAVMASRAPTERPLEATAITIFGALYTGVLLSFILTIRHSDSLPSAGAATWLVFLPLVVTWASDSLAMAGGSAFRGPRLAPVLSPNKTWSGAVTGAVGAFVLAPAYGALVLAPVGVTIHPWRLALFGLAISVVGQLGDLAESLFKRQVGVKDSGKFFPGHGGVLDRFDSLYWVIPTAALLLTVFGTI
jgi:phosphatidate cytidylyltransferase